MRIPPVACLFLALLAAPSAAGDEPVPEGATLSVTTKKPEYLLGERVELVLTFRNSGPKPFRICPMTWQRFAVRDELVEVSMADAEGRPAWDPFPERMGGGGPVPDDVTLAKGEEWSEEVDLWRYRIPERAGTWKIKVSRSFGWQESPERPNPSAEISLRFREPTAAEAGKVLDGLLAEDRKYRLYSAAYPVYVPLLEARAAEGLVEASQGLALNRDPAATRALLRLFASKNRAVANRAGGYLVDRIRVPVKEGEGEARTGDGYGHYFRSTSRNVQVSLLDMVPAWKPEFAEEARTAARAFLAADGLPVAGAAAEVLQLLGTPEDGPAVSAAFDRFALQFDTVETDWNAPGYYDRERDRERDKEGLEVALYRFVRRGFPVPSRPKTAAEAQMWMDDLRTREIDQRPAEWWETLKTLASHPRALVRMNVAHFARAGDVRMPGTCALIVTQLLKDPDKRVREAAGEGR